LAPGRDDDGVLALLVDEDHGYAAGRSLADGDVLRLNTMSNQAIEQTLAKIVVAHPADHVNLGPRPAQPGGGHRLVGALAAGDGDKGPAQQRLSRGGNARGADDQGPC